ncbi:hypothetical protein, partial [Neglectibacter timonensis]|uniref:hypothetical protein n=1 Tax=Neglectibacter timonensis TaxID=1776382 RepID=UPI003991D8A8
YEPTEPAGETTSFCPCQKWRGKPYAYLSAFRYRAEGVGNEVRPACRGASTCQWHVLYEPTEPAGETTSFCPCQKVRYRKGDT